MGSGIDSLRELYDARRLEEAWREYEQLRQIGPVEAEGHLLGALAARRKGDLRGARTAFERGLDLAPTGRVLGQLRMTYGATLREIGDTSAAIEMLELFLADMDLYPELRPVANGAGHHNLALAYRTARRFDEARQAYETAILDFRAENLLNYLAWSCLNLAWLCCLMGDAERAEDALAEAEGVCDTEELRWHLQIGIAFLEATTARPTDAIERCEGIVKKAESAPPEVVSHAYWLSGRIALAAGQMDAAEGLAGQAVDWAIRAKHDVRPLQDASELRREIHKAKVEKQRGA
ncbi:MAG TPA: tetratricopeptide repeat protein [Symbiobacteriaceae bacterium]|nr:tetratricopeptide repeat protein [Symbiobacteriaceae bacterium]